MYSEIQSNSLAQADKVKSIHSATVTLPLHHGSLLCKEYDYLIQEREYTYYKYQDVVFINEMKFNS